MVEKILRIIIKRSNASKISRTWRSRYQITFVFIQCHICKKKIQVFEFSPRSDIINKGCENAETYYSKEDDCRYLHKAAKACHFVQIHIVRNPKDQKLQCTPCPSLAGPNVVVREWYRSLRMDWPLR